MALHAVNRYTCYVMYDNSQQACIDTFLASWEAMSFFNPAEVLQEGGLGWQYPAGVATLVNRSRFILYSDAANDANVQLAVSTLNTCLGGPGGGITQLLVDSTNMIF